jgi:mRNA interferase MazF
MNQKRKKIPETGDVILLDFPGVKKTKRRPAVIVSSTLYHRQRSDVIVGLITSQVEVATAATDYVLKYWAHARLRQPSAYRTFLTTIPRSAVYRCIGKLSARDWHSVLRCLQLGIGDSN